MEKMLKKLNNYKIQNKSDDIITNELKKIFKKMVIPKPKISYHYFWNNGVQSGKLVKVEDVYKK